MRRGILSSFGQIWTVNQKFTGRVKQEQKKGSWLKSPFKACLVHWRRISFAIETSPQQGSNLELSAPVHLLHIRLYLKEKKMILLELGRQKYLKIRQIGSECTALLKLLDKISHNYRLLRIQIYQCLRKSKLIRLLCWHLDPSLTLIFQIT